MTLDISVHKTILFQILKEIYSDSTIAPLLGFKGGTAALMFYNLSRFSVDLDFDLLDEHKEQYVFDRVIEILKKFGAIRDMKIKRYSLFCSLSYEDKAHNIKIEINKRTFGSEYEIKTYLGVSMLVMTQRDMLANKIVAMYERIGKTSRDIFDVWYFLHERFPINKEIVEIRTNKQFIDFVGLCIDKLEKLNNKKILVGLGELLDENQKDWVKAKLREDTIILLKLLRETNNQSI